MWHGAGMERGANTPAFGRRGAAAPIPRAARETPRALPVPKAPPVPKKAPPVQTAPPDGISWSDTSDPELEDWKRARGWHPPWRQISLMASLCFGIGSLVLPGTVNDAVQWILYALAGASLYAGLRKRRTR